MGVELVRQKFTRHSRLLRPAEFKRVFERPSRSSDHCFRVLARPNSALGHRLGLAVAKKAVPRAVGRNRIKRLVRESFRTQMGGTIQTGALDIVVLPTAQAAEKTNAALFESLNAHWQKLNKRASFRATDPGRPTKDT